MQPSVAVTRLTGFDLRVRDPARSARFYREALGFAEAPPDGGASCVRLKGVRLRLLATARDAMPAPPAAANARDFQHFAIRVADMAAAYARVSSFGPEPLSRGGPQRLPPADGCVTAWKFRDPDGHPLELLQPAAHEASGAAALFEAVDHTALACADPAASLAFYERLGFAQGPSSHNQGAPQDRLDGLDGVDLRIATVHTPAAGPHVELLHYLHPSPAHAMAEAAEAFVRTRLEAGGGPATFTDPDGHRLLAAVTAEHG